MGKARKNLGLGLVCLSFVFLFDPPLAIIDFLPDLIGYLLLCIGISQLADMNYHFEEALRYFKRMVAVSAIQLLSFFVFGIVPSRELPTTILLLTFTFSVIQVVFLSHAYTQFFEGFLYLGSRMNAKNVFHTEKQQLRFEKIQAKKSERLKRLEVEKPQKFSRLTKRKRNLTAIKNNTTSTLRITVVFVVIKAVLSVLPEFSVLAGHSDGSSPFYFLHNHTSMFRAISLCILIPLGIWWMLRSIGYIRSIIQDRPFMQALTDKYVTEIQPKTHIFIQRAIKLAFTVFAIGTAFSIDFYVDNNSILPDFLCPLIFLVALILLKRFIKVPVYSYLACCVNLISSAVVYWLSAVFYSSYTLSLATFRVDAYEAFQVLTVAKIADSVLFFGMILSCLPVLTAVVREYTGFSPVTAPNVQIQDKIRYVHGYLQKKLTVFGILAVLCCASGIAYILLLKRFNFMWIIDFLVCLCFTVYSISMLNTIGEEVQYKYLLD